MIPVKRNNASLYFDVGSTMARVIQGSDVLYCEPSCIAVHTKSEQVVAVGVKAYQLLGKTTEQVELIFPIQYGVVANRFAFEQLLQAILKSVQPHSDLWSLILGLHGGYAALSTISPSETAVLRRSLKAVGLGRVQPINQMVAAALHLKLRDRVGQSYCLIDIGGQVSEVAIVTGGEVVASTRLKWGGVQCTERIQEAIMEKHECAVSWHTAEVVKRQLGIVSDDDSFTKHKVSIRGKHLLSQLGQTVVVSNQDIAPVCTEFAYELFKAIQQLFTQAPTEVVTSCLEQGIFLIGGGSLLKGLPEFLQKNLHTEVNVSQEPELVVSRGLTEMDI
jgi:rod shape-determining protein MreB